MQRLYGRRNTIAERYLTGIAPYFSRLAPRYPLPASRSSRLACRFHSIVGRLSAAISDAGQGRFIASEGARAYTDHQREMLAIYQLKGKEMFVRRQIIIMCCLWMLAACGGADRLQPGPTAQPEDRPTPT